MSNIVLDEILKLRDKKEDQLIRLKEEMYKYEESLEAKKHLVRNLEKEIEEINAVLNLLNVKSSEV